MEEHWTMRTEAHTPKLSSYPPQQYTEYITTTEVRKTVSDDILGPEDFADVFGGPPRTILSHRFHTPGFFYEDIFRQTEKAARPVRRRGRNLPQIRIPSGKQSSSECYQKNRHRNDLLNHIFGKDAERVVRSRSRSKTSSSSALSSEELSPLRPAISDDGLDDISLFASKLRFRWDLTRIRHEDHQKQQQWPAFSGSQPISSSKNDFPDNLSNCPFRFSRRNEFPESINLDRSFRESPDDLQFNSPASAVPSFSLSDRDIENCDIEAEIMREDDMEQDEDESMSSYVIEINSGNRETVYESNGVDEAIAWAKQKFQSHSSEQKQTEDFPNEHQLSEGPSDCSPSMDEQQDRQAAEEETNKIIMREYSSSISSHLNQVQEEMHLLDEKIRLWSTGKEGDIRLLLSSLHHIIWPNSGWLMISLKNLLESSQVRKAYQKAMLCLHPDKLQQRGATLPEKYIAEKAFSALQILGCLGSIYLPGCLLPLKKYILRRERNRVQFVTSLN